MALSTERDGFFKTSMTNQDLAAREVWVRVPGTTSNLGPGFDCLGAALNVSNLVKVATGVTGESHPMVDDVVACFHRQPELEGREPEDMTWSIEGEVPISRGLGSSVTLRLGVLAALNELHGGPLNRRRLYELCAMLEGHPDNAGPAVFGGFFVGGPGGAHFRFPVGPDLRFVAIIRGHAVRTEEARDVLPDQVPFADAVANVGNAAAVVAAFASGDYGQLSGVLHDALHEPYREPYNRGLRDIVNAGTGAGAYGGFLSGSGSTVIGLCPPERMETVGRAMAEACPETEPPEVLHLQVDNEGLQIVERIE